VKATWKAIRPAAGSKRTSTTCQGSANPSAALNNDN
jgi:hypothetical protein